jgi:hypothetical protein
MLSAQAVVDLIKRAPPLFLFAAAARVAAATAIIDCQYRGAFNVNSESKQRQYFISDQRGQ